MIDLRSHLGAAREQVAAVNALRGLGMLSPAVATKAARQTSKWGPTPPAGYAAAAERIPTQTAIIDDDGFVSFGEVDQVSNALATLLQRRGVGPDDAVAILCRNHRWFVHASNAVAKVGASTLYLNTGFAGPQLREVLDREGAAMVIHDEEFRALVDDHVGHLPRLVAWSEGGRGDLEASIVDVPRTGIAPPEAPGRQIILTSGTTGTPKGAKRPTPKGLVAMTGIFRVIPWQVGDIHLVAAPMFHALGNGGYQMSAQFSHRMILQRRFDPEETLRAIDAHGVTAMTCVPVMLQRILELPDEVLDRYSASTLRLVQCSGAALPGSLAVRWMDRFGDNLYNMFASTEVGTVTIATPADMRAAPGTAGRAVPGTKVVLFDSADDPIVEPGVTGRIFVDSGLQFEGYTSGDSKPTIGNLMSIGDVGHWDDGGRLHVGGRDDDMIISGGENVFPREIEDLLADHEAIAEAAVIGVADDEFGARLKAFVVLRAGAVLTEAAVKDHVKQNLASYKVPKAVVFLATLPRNQTGKVLKRELV